MDKLSKELRRIAADLDKYDDDGALSHEEPRLTEEGLEARRKDNAEITDKATSSKEAAKAYFELIEDALSSGHRDNFDLEADGVEDETMDEACSIVQHWFKEDPKWTDEHVDLQALAKIHESCKRDWTEDALALLEENPSRAREALDVLKENKLLHVEFVEQDIKDPGFAEFKSLLEQLL